MADETVVTELIIDARGAEQGSAAYVKAMKAAQNAVDKVIEREQAATVAIEKQTTVMTNSAGSLTSTARAWDRLRASVDPTFRATQSMEKALLVTSAASTKLGVSSTEVARIMALVKAKTEETATATAHGASASALGATQMAALGHSARSAAESIAMGQSPMMVLTQQANHLSYAMSGPQGLIAASAGVRSAFGTWLTTLPGMLSVAGVAAVAAVSVYMLATREKILSVDEILKDHKKLLDDVASTYPHLTEALKKYNDEAAKLPHSVLAADSATLIKETQKSLAASLDHLKVDLRDLARAQDVVGTAGAEAFGKLADTIDAGNVDVDALVRSLGDIRLDPSLTPDAKHFADNLQGAALEAKKLADTLAKEQGVKSIGIDGQKATKTLAEVSAGFKDVGSKASSADATIAKLFGDMSGSGSGGFGVTRSVGGLSGSIQGVVGQFEQAGQAIQNMRREQVQSMLDLTAQFRDTTTQVDSLKKAIAGAAGKENIAAFFGDVSNIKNANSELQNSVDTVNKLFDALNTGNTSANAVAGGLDMIRQTLVNGGFGVDQVNKFIDSLIKARMQMDAGVNDAKQLDRAIQAIKNRTITITVVTRQVGSGTQSIYDVPGGSVGVTRYGGVAGQQSGPSMSSVSVPSTGYGSQGGYGNGGTSTVGVTKFSSTGPWENPYGATANEWSKLTDQNKQDIYNGKTDYAHILYPDYYRASGGPISPGSPYWVGEKGPELVVPTGAATVIPHAQSMALADPQSAFTGQVATRDTDRMWQVFMNIEANTRKTYEGVDKWGLSSSYSSSGGSSGSGSSSFGGGSQGDQLSAQYYKVLASIKSNFHAAGIVGGGQVGYNSNGLGATPQQIATNIVYGGGGSPLGSPGANTYENTLSSTAAYHAYIEAQRYKQMYGFSSGGIMGPGNGDSQRVEFFKRPSERVIIADPEQFDDQRSGSGRSGSGAGRPIQYSQTNHWYGNAPPSKESLAAARRATELGMRDALRSVNGR